jgi:8-oxo-dGTP diphosphatase
VPPQVGVGVAAFIFDYSQDTVLLLKRAGSHGAGTWAPPGGWVEAGESLLEAAEREVREEVGMDVEAIQEFGYTEDHFPEGVHDICFSVVCKFDMLGPSGPRIMEPEKITDLGWFGIDGEVDSLDLFLPMRQRVDTGDLKTMYQIFKENQG